MRVSLNAYRRPYAALWTAPFLVLLVLSFRQVKRTGDGLEYLLSARALSAHLSPDFRKDDIEYVGNILNQSEPGLRENIENAIETLRTVPGRPNGVRYWGGFIQTADGTLYSWHFWLYSAFVVPFLQIVQWLRLPPLYAFVLCNWAFMLGALFYLTSHWKAKTLQRHVLTGLFLSTGTTYYIRWTHPEVFTASLILLALMLMSDRRHGWAMLASALAAAQNPPVMLLVAYIGTVAVLHGRGFRSANSSLGGEIENGGKNLLVILATVSVALSPLVFFRAAVGVFNPITAAGSAQVSLISASRLWSLYFDLNQGMVVAAPGVLLGAAALPFLIVLASRQVERGGGVLWQMGPLFIGVFLSVAMAVPSLATRNWNSGQAVFMRYAYWLGIPIVFGLVATLARLPRRVSMGVGIGVVVIQIATVGYYGIVGGASHLSELSLKPIASYVLRNYPELYSPVPEIFVERVRRAGGWPRIGGGQQMYLYPEEGEPTKILLASGRARVIADTCQTASPTEVEGGWAYLSLRGERSCVKEMLAQGGVR